MRLQCTILFMLALQPGQTVYQTNDRKELLYGAKVAEKIERYEEMADMMYSLASLDIGMTVEERKLLSRAYETLIKGRKTALEKLLDIENEDSEDVTDEARKTILGEFKNKIQNEIVKISNEVKYILKKYLLPNAMTDEFKAFIYRMEGDYNRYISEATTDQEKKTAEEAALDAYKIASEIAINVLPPTNLVRLEIALNFSEFYYDVLGSLNEACTLAKLALDVAIQELYPHSLEGNKESVEILQQLRNNLKLWTSDTSIGDNKD